MSGTTPWVSKAQKWVPTRPNPTWTSSAMVTPPPARTMFVAAVRKPSAGTTWPPHPISDSAMNAPTLPPAPSIATSAARTSSA